MPAVVIVVLVLFAFFLGYRFYSKYLAEKVYGLDKARPTPAHEFEDGVDYVPTNKHILFGHHFTSVAGAAPITGPAIAVFWGWVPALLWVVLGTIFAAGAHDFGSIVVSVRNRAQNIGTLAGSVISRRARTLFLVIIFFLLTLVNAVFSIVMATLFIGTPSAVIPAAVVIPIAIAIGQLVYRRRGSIVLPTIVGLIILYATIPLGQAFPITVDPLAGALGLEAQTVWVIILFTYTWFAARLPVWLLLQPRDYINSYQLFVALAVIFIGVAVGLNTIVAPAFNQDLPEGSPFWFPFLFITIACGAISGFHSLVASGTTSKQLDNEQDARYVGYMGSLGEGSLALASILACTAGIGAYSVWQESYSSFNSASANGLGNFTTGVGEFVSNIGIPAAVGATFAAVVVITFAGTTLDTAVRLQRYVVQEIGEITGVRTLSRNMTLAATIAVLLSAGLALFPYGGGGEAGFAFGVLWQLFGTTNQLTAGLALAVIAVWVLASGRNPLAAIIPLVFLLTMTSWALLINLGNFFRDGAWLLLVLDIIIFVLAVWLIVEAVAAMNRVRRERRAGGADADAGATDRSPERPPEG
ncbi:Carbon starvation protein predicted membrane protein [Rubrobacter radiotolerans]|uniref:Carbon starvation protein A n=1 Tax=Rubrobacter radiotolerans TaxID=42256 RepID=A0A023X5D3_RUBRA|nr:carbon starvation protein A [Rubrobacter radiotolerans]AHY47667.1 Carbon starvation protein predicted membrane protein [Rubrobacter radiotolerans]MDX5895070.1 carbon starvation protein A [Rubrobacter radiotolerans]SMC07390.1 carbon starvation protein [Rubrobacter radiotolerans DSM 5868]